ncbi:hypothetical protein [Pseudoxanthomonas putridarboris]|uniref:Glycosyltransferase RgtA/B/C/D-like domain-containing protein n=1 Tax=Pseudoxanthomonas putridarboris TaxID=752605 RepID=A0ABU9J1F5_9GAMM
MNPTQRRHMAGMAAVAVLSLSLVYFYYIGLYCSDDTRYLIGAIKIAIGEPISTASLAERRVLLLLPAAAGFAITGSLGFSVALYGIWLVAIGCATYLLARRQMAVWASVACAALALAQPVFFLFAGSLLPDVPAALFLALALGSFWRWSEARLSGTHRQVLLHAAVTGVCLALGFMLKESSIVLLVVPLAFLAVWALMGRFRQSLEAGIALMVGLLAMLLLESMVFRVTAGQWYSSIASLLNPHDFSLYVEEQGRTPLARLHTLGGLLGWHTSFLFLAAALATLQLAWQRYRGAISTESAWAWAGVVAFWFWPLLYFTFGSASLSEYRFPVMQQRYYAPCIVPAALLAGRLLASLELPGWLRGLSRPVALAALAGLVCAPYLLRHQRGLVYSATAKEAFEVALQDAQRRFPGIPVVDSDTGWTTDLNRCRVLLASAGGGSQARLLDSIRSGEDLSGHFGYPNTARLKLPIIVVGHGDYFTAQPLSPWIRGLQRRIERENLTVERIGRYDVRPRRALKGLWWLPREQAVALSLRTVSARESLQRPADAPEEEEYALLPIVDLYLVGEGTAEQ